MAKVTAQEIQDMGFVPEMFRRDSINFEEYILDIISEQSGILSAEIGSDTYASTDSGIAAKVKRAERCLTAAELVQRRINVLLGNVKAGAEIDISHEGAQKKAYRDEAAALITALTSSSGTSGTGSDFAAGVVVTSHFEAAT